MVFLTYFIYRKRRRRVQGHTAPATSCEVFQAMLHAAQMMPHDPCSTCPMQQSSCTMPSSSRSSRSSCPDTQLIPGSSPLRPALEFPCCAAERSAAAVNDDACCGDGATPLAARASIESAAFSAGKENRPKGLSTLAGAAATASAAALGAAEAGDDGGGLGLDTCFSCSCCWCWCCC